MLRVALLVQDLQLSGGMGVIVHHAVRLRRDHGIDATIVLTNEETGPPWPFPGLDEVPVLSFDDAAQRTWDVAVATWWHTATSLFRLQADRYAYFVQLLEDVTYDAGDPLRLAAAMTTSLPVSFMTEARWIADFLEDVQPGARVHYVRNGIPKQVFNSPASVEPSLPRRPLRIVVEGARGYRQKGVDDALEAVAAMREPAHLTWVSPHGAARPRKVDRMCSGLSHAEMAELFAETDVLVKLPRSEGMYGPPLEAFHMGSTVVTTPVTGHDEYVVHGRNGLVVGWDDLPGTTRALDLLARNRRLLHRLRCEALATARAWPDWSQASQVMALALRRIAADPPPSSFGAGLRVATDLGAVAADVQLQHRRIEVQEAILEDLFTQKAWQYAIRARRQLDRVRAVRTRTASAVRRLR